VTRSQSEGGNRSPRLVWQAIRMIALCLTVAACLGFVPAPHGRTPTSVRADVALVLSGDLDYLRVERAATLYRQDSVRNLLVTGAGAGGDSAVVLRGVAVAAGVPPDRIFVESDSKTTHENVLFSAPLVRSHGWKRVALVTSLSHMGRAERAARSVMPEVEWIPVPSPDPGTRVTIYRTRLLEWAKLLWYKVRGWA
jgi:uncharacterized SAM-binding protein YcdF (DUF218 family)